MNRLLSAWGAVVAIVGLGVYLSEYYGPPTCNGWCAYIPKQVHPGILLLVPLGLIVFGYSFRRKGRTYSHGTKFRRYRVRMMSETALAEKSARLRPLSKLN